MSRACAVALAWILATPPCAAAAGGSWSASSGEEFGEGSLEGTAVDEEGRLHLAWARETVWGPQEGVVWDLAPDGSGGVFVGLSAPGRVVHLDREGTAEVWYEAGAETIIAALVADGDGGVWLGLSPDGEIVHVPEAGGEATAVDVEASFVWGLDRGADGSLWIATGVPGTLLRRDRQGGLRTVFDSGDDPVRCVRALDGGGALAGTGGRGRVIRFSADDRAYVLLDAEEPEIVDVALATDGSYYALAARASKPGRGTRSAPPQAQETVRVVASPPDEGGDGEADDEGEPVEPPQRSSAPPRMPVTPGGAVLYRLTTDRGARAVWTAAKEMPFALAAAEGGSLLLATGDLGRISRVDETGRSAIVAQIPSDQASAIAVDPRGGYWIGGASDARVERVGPGALAAGSYVTPAVDAGAMADWGRVAWDAEIPRGARVRLSVRGGNTDEPDSTWSDWVDLKGAAGEGLAEGLDASRRLQARVRMEPSSSGDSPRLRHLEIYFQPHNRPPEVREIAVQPAGVVWSANPAQAARPKGPLVADDPVSRRAVKTLDGPSTRGVRKSFELGARTVSWKAADPDEDRLSFTLEIRREGTNVWLPLATSVEDEYYGWDTRDLPDGLYRVRLTASDAPDNPGGKDLHDRSTSTAFRVDNTRPSIAEPRIEPSAAGFEVEFVASDPGGAVAAVEVAVDGGDWEPLDPLDGVADSATERYQTTVGAREHADALIRSIRVRVTDVSGNLGGDAWALEPGTDR